MAPNAAVVAHCAQHEVAAIKALLAELFKRKQTGTLTVNQNSNLFGLFVEIWEKFRPIPTLPPPDVYVQYGSAGKWQVVDYSKSPEIELLMILSRSMYSFASKLEMADEGTKKMKLFAVAIARLLQDESVRIRWKPSERA